MSETGDPRLLLEKARWSLAALWFSGAGGIFLILVAMSSGSALEGRAVEVWSWILPHLVPTLSLMTSVLATTAVEPGEAGEDRATVRRGFSRLTLGVSAFYLMMILAAIFAAPIVDALRSDEKFTLVDAIKLSNLWLAPLQGIVVLCIGTLFFKKERKNERAAEKKKRGSRTTAKST